MTPEHEQQDESDDCARTDACADGKGNRENRLPKSARAWASRSSVWAPRCGAGAAGSESKKNRKYGNRKHVVDRGSRHNNSRNFVFFAPPARFQVEHGGYDHGRRYGGDHGARQARDRPVEAEQSAEQHGKR